MYINLKNRNQRGDTIVEVMFALAIIGMVLAAAYSIASKNLQASQLSKERTQATQIAESQIEQLKALREDPGDGAFCLNIESADYITSISDVNNVTETSCISGHFAKSITKNGDEYTVLVEWIPPGGSATNKSRVVLTYKDYDFAISATSNLVIFRSEYAGTSAVLGVRISNEPVSIRRGVVYGESRNLAIGASGTTVVNGANSDSFSVLISPLDASRTYYARAFVEISAGVYKYGSAILISDTASTPISSLTVVTGAVSGVTASQATVAGTVTGQNGATASERGIVYGTSVNPTILNTKVPAGSGLGSFSAVVSISTPAMYYARAYAISGQGIPVYGDQVPLNFLPTSVNVVVMKIPPTASNTTPSCSSSATLNRSGTSVTLNGQTRTTNSSSTASFTGLGRSTSYTITANSAPSGHELCSTSTTVTTGVGGSTVTNSSIKIRPVCYSYISHYNSYWTRSTRRANLDAYYSWSGVPGGAPSNWNTNFVAGHHTVSGNYWYEYVSGTTANVYYRLWDAVWVNDPVYAMQCPA